MILLLIPIIGIALMTALLNSMLLVAPDVTELRAAAAAQSMAIYRQAVTDWAGANIAAPSQTVADASLVFPYGYVKNFAWTNIVVSGHGWVYTVDSTISGRGGMASALLIQSEYSMQVGTNVGGFLWSPRAGNMNIPVNPAIPNGSLIWGF